MESSINYLGDPSVDRFSSCFDMSVCKGCGKSEFIDDEQTGDRICTSCGEVLLSNLLSEEPEWRSYKEDGNAEDDARVDTFVDSFLDGNTLSTDFLYEGKSLNSKQQALIRRFENPQEAKRSRKLISIHSTIQETATELGLTSAVVREAFNLYTKCFTLMHIRSKRPEIIVAACLYLACRQCHSFRLISEIVNILSANLNKTVRLSQVIIDELKLIVETPTDADYIGRYCSMLLLPRSVYNMAIKLIQVINEKKYENVSGRSLTSVAVLMASRLCDVEEPPSIHDICTIAMKTEKNVIRMYKSVYTHCDEILVYLFKDDVKINAKAIMKMTQKLELKRM